jgi:hypothetical protein
MSDDNFNGSFLSSIQNELSYPQQSITTTTSHLQPQYPQQSQLQSHPTHDFLSNYSHQYCQLSHQPFTSSMFKPYYLPDLSSSTTTTTTTTTTPSQLLLSNLDSQLIKATKKHKTMPTLLPTIRTTMKTRPQTTQQKAKKITFPSIPIAIDPSIPPVSSKLQTNIISELKRNIGEYSKDPITFDLFESIRSYLTSNHSATILSHQQQNKDNNVINTNTTTSTDKLVPNSNNNGNNNTNQCKFSSTSLHETDILIPIIIPSLDENNNIVQVIKYIPTKRFELFNVLFYVLQRLYSNSKTRQHCINRTLLSNNSKIENEASKSFTTVKKLISTFLRLVRTSYRSFYTLLQPTYIKFCSSLRLIKHVYSQQKSKKKSLSTLPLPQLTHNKDSLHNLYQYYFNFKNKRVIIKKKTKSSITSSQICIATVKNKPKSGKRMNHLKTIWSDHHPHLFPSPSTTSIITPSPTTTTKTLINSRHKSVRYKQKRKKKVRLTGHRIFLVSLLHTLYFCKKIPRH